MSNVDDSSSLEYLDESQYLEEDDHYTQFLLPPVPPQRHQSKPVQQQPFSPMHHPPNSVGAANPADVIVEPEYTEADPGALGMAGTYRSLPDGVPLLASTPCGTSMLMTSGSSSSLRPRPKEPMMMHQSNSLYSPVMDRAGVSLFNLPFYTIRQSSVVNCWIFFL